MELYWSTGTVAATSGCPALTPWPASIGSTLVLRLSFSLSAGKEETGTTCSLPQLRDFCVYSKAGEEDGSLYCFTYQDAIHHPVCEDPITSSTIEPSATSDDGFVPPVFETDASFR